MLDSKETVKSIDRKDMLGTIERLPQHMAEGLRRGRMSGLPRFTPRNVIVCGLGGSAIGGDLLSEWLSSHSGIPCAVSRSYSVPPFVDKDSLVLLASYSGNTEETISMFEDARRKRAKMVTISSGGQLAQMSETYGVPFARLPTGMVPRASLGYMFGAMLGVVERTGAVQADKQFEEAVKVIGSVVSSCKQSVRTADNPAKRLAHELFGYVPIVVGYGLSVPVAKRWANQLNENAKSMAYSTELPELDHNEIVGWAHDARSKGFAAVFLEHDDQNRSMMKRLEVTKSFVSRSACVFGVPSIGLSPLAKMFSLVAMGDFVSAYLGILRKEDPSSMGPIEELKSVLAKK